MYKGYKKLYRTLTYQPPWWKINPPQLWLIMITSYNYRKHFGIYDQQQFILSPLGHIAKNHLEKLSADYSHLSILHYNITPNQLHLIIHLKEQGIRRPLPTSKYVSTEEWHSFISPTKKSISAALRSLKSSITNDCRTIYPMFEWKKGFETIPIGSKSKEVNPASK